MREIKFRVWLNGLRNMCEVKSIHFDSGIVYVKHEEHHNGYDKSRSEVYDIVGCHAVPVMRYTGLKDKNGKEIYEGDIVKYESIYGCLGVGVVDFDEGMFCVSHLSLAQLDVIEIIGNIYENKELLSD